MITLVYDKELRCGTIDFGQKIAGTIGEDVDRAGCLCIRSEIRGSLGFDEGLRRLSAIFARSAAGWSLGTVLVTSHARGCG